MTLKMTKLMMASRVAAASSWASYWRDGPHLMLLQRHHWGHYPSQHHALAIDDGGGAAAAAVAVADGAVAGAAADEGCQLHASKRRCTRRRTDLDLAGFETRHDQPDHAEACGDAADSADAAGFDTQASSSHHDVIHTPVLVLVLVLVLVPVLAFAFVVGAAPGHRGLHGTARAVDRGD